MFDALNASHGSEATQKIEAELAPLLAAHADAINLDAVLFARLDQLYECRSALGLDAESLALLDVYGRVARALLEMAEDDGEKKIIVSPDTPIVTFTPVV